MPFYRRVTPFLQKTARLIANGACQLGGLPTINQLSNKIDDYQDELQIIEEQQHALYRVISRIRASLELDTIFKTTTKETCKLLQVERVSIYRFFDDWGGQFVEDFEFCEPEFCKIEILGKDPVWNDTHLQHNQGGRYRNNETLAVSDIYQAGLSPCHIEILEQFQIRAYATAPIFKGNQLWGILAAYQHSGTYQWQKQQMKFLSQIATQLGIAIKQADLMSQTEQKAQSLEAANQQQKILWDVIIKIRESLDINKLFNNTAREARKALQVDRVGIFQFHPGSHYCSGEFVAENVLPEYDSVIATPIQDHCFGDQFAIYYEQGRIQVLSNIYEQGLKTCHLNILEQFQIQAQMVVPILKDQKLWGLLCIHQCRAQRVWKQSEIQFARQLAVQFSVALDHAELLKQYQKQSQKLQETIQQLEQANSQLEQLTILDPLTQIPNRRFFDQRLQKEWENGIKTGKALSLILIDLDHFKDYNDRYGHPAGDTCLLKTAQAIAGILKQSNHCVCRYGGEEFAVILPETELSETLQIVKEIQEGVRDLKLPNPLVDDKQPFLTISLGIANEIPKIDKTVQCLLNRADRALYKAKAQGRNTWMVAELERVSN